MNIIHMQVIHQAFGEGIVVSAEDHHVQIDFGAKGIRTFIYPDAFEKFIRLRNVEAQSQVEAEISAAQMTRKAAELALEEKKRTISTVLNADSKKKTLNVDTGFGPDYHVEYLARQPILTYQKVEDEFGIKIAGFGRGINKTDKTVVLISSIGKKKAGFVYHDHWDSNGDYIYSGEGKCGDQKMTGGNLAIRNAAADGKTIHLFVKFSPQEYYYQGVFKLAGYTLEDEHDENGGIRKEYQFRLRKRPS